MKNYTYELLESLNDMLEGYEENCRYDHNGNCQEHSWFGLDGNECPVGKARKLVELIENEKLEHVSNRKTSWDVKALLEMAPEERDAILTKAAEIGYIVYDSFIKNHETKGDMDAQP